MQELFRGHLAHAVRPTGSRQMQRGQAGIEDSVAVGDLRIPLRNWSPAGLQFGPCPPGIAVGDRMLITVTIRNRSEEHTSELQSLMRISYAVFCLKKKNITTHIHQNTQPFLHNKLNT